MVLLDGLNVWHHVAPSYITKVLALFFGNWAINSALGLELARQLLLYDSVNWIF